MVIGEMDHPYLLGRRLGQLAIVLQHIQHAHSLRCSLNDNRAWHSVLESL